MRCRLTEDKRGFFIFEVLHEDTQSWRAWCISKTYERAISFVNEMWPYHDFKIEVYEY